MIKKRRFYITEKEGDITLLALVAGISEVEKIIQAEPTIYWKMTLIEMERLKDKLQNYKWEVEK